MIQAIEVPEIGENVESGVVVAVHIKPGDTVAVDDTVIELETDKALVEIPSPFQGRVEEVLAKEGAQINVGDVIARVEVDAEDADADAADRSETDEAGSGESGADAVTQEDKQETQTPEGSEEEKADDASGESEPAGKNKDDRTFRPSKPDRQAQQKKHPSEKGADHPPVAAAPSIRRLARELGVDINQVSGNGPGGRISEDDVKATVRKQQKADEGPAGGGQVSDTNELPDFSRWGEVQIEKMDTVRRLTARSTAASWINIPHVTQFEEADITGVMDFIEKNAPKAEKAGAKLTITAIITRVCAEALRRFPRLNASIDVANHRIILKRYVHIGIAADTPRGLLVPVIRDADKKSIIDLAKTIGDLAQRARNKKIKPDELAGGTFSISNQGGIGGVGFTPIVLWPQVAILGVSRAAAKPVFLQDRFEPRTILPLSLSYDHRIIDGADAARFLRWICEGLEQPMTLFLD
jgi:pyruvate dehydrogenase E2 component (dihydrolipoamide acetyltransferase)